MPPKRDFRSLVVSGGILCFFFSITSKWAVKEAKEEMKHGEVERDEHDEVRQKATLNIRFFSVSDSPPSAWLHRNEYLSIEINKARKSSDMLNECVWYDVTACMMRTDKRQAARFSRHTTAAARVWTSTSSLFWCVFSVWIIFHFSWNFTHSLHTTASIARHRQAWKSLTLHSAQQKQPGTFGIC